MKPYKKLFILIFLIVLPITNTYAWYCLNFDKDIAVSSASEQDIIKDIIINEVNPEYIEINKAEYLDQNPVIYFGIEGEIKNYITHINPVKLETEETMVPINFCFGPDQIINLVEGNIVFTGTIKIKYLNEYVDISKNVCFTSDFLISKLYQQIYQTKNSLDSDRLVRVNILWRKNKDIFLNELNNIFQTGNNN